MASPRPEGPAPEAVGVPAAAGQPWLLDTLDMLAWRYTPKIRDLGHCQVQLWKTPPFARVYRDGRLRYASKGHGQIYHIQLADLAGDPKPELCLLGGYGGTYPHSDVAILDPDTLTVLFEHVGTTAGPWSYDSWPAIADFTGDGVPEFSYTDKSVGPFKGYPRLLCRLTDEGMQIAPDLMARRTIPSEQELVERARDARFPEPAFGHYNDEVAFVQDLVYRGRPELARHYFDLAWPAARPGKEAYWQEIQENLRQGDHWEIIQALDGR